MTQPSFRDSNTLDNHAGPQGIMDSDIQATGGNAVSLLDRHRPTETVPTQTGPGGKPPRPRFGWLSGWAGVAAGFVVVALLVVLGIYLITRDSGPGPVTNSPPPTVAQSSGPTAQPSTPAPTAQTPEQIAVAGAAAGFRRHDAVLQRMYQSGGKDVAALPSVATGLALKFDQSAAKTSRNRGYRQIGVVPILWTKAKSIGFPNHANVVTDVTIQACFDITKGQTLDRHGKPLPKAGPETRMLEEAAMTLVGGVWKAKESTNRPVMSC